MTIRSITAVGPHGNFILATDTEVWKYFAPGVDAMSRPWPERWQKIELPKELRSQLSRRGDPPTVDSRY